VKESLLSMDAIKQIHQEGRLEEAKAAYLALLAKNPIDVDALHFLGVLYVQEGELDLAISNFKKAFGCAPQDPTIALHLANSLRAKNLYQEAEQVLQGVLKAHPEFAAGFNNLGTVYYAEEKWQAAVDAYQAAVRLQANYADAYYNLGLTFIKLNNHDAAMRTYEALLTLLPQHAGALFQMACLLMRKEQHEKALVYFLRLTQAHPFHVETLINLAACYLELQAPEKAKIYYLKALALTPTDKQVLFNLGVIAAKAGQTNEAIVFYTDAVKAHPDFYAAHLNLAALYLSSNNKTAALKHFHEALRLQPTNTAVQHSINVLSATEKVQFSPPAYIQSLFDSYADHYDQHLQHVLHYQVPALFLKTLTAHFQHVDKKLDILDLGCGTGLCGEVIKPYARSLIGVDLSEKMLAVAAAKQVYDELLAADMLTYLQNHPRCFDLIMAGDTLVYVGDLAEILSQLHQALKPKGLLLFNLEVSDEAAFHMQVSGRFSHSKQYIDELVLAHHFKVLAYQAVSLRQQDQKAVPGHLYLLEALEKTPHA